MEAPNYTIQMEAEQRDLIMRGLSKISPNGTDPEVRVVWHRMETVELGVGDVAVIRAALTCLLTEKLEGSEAALTTELIDLFDSLPEHEAESPGCVHGFCL